MSSDKNSHPTEESVAKKSVKKMDTLITGMILGGIIASIYGVKKFKEKTDHDEHANHLILQDTDNHDQHNSRAKKRGILSRIFFGNK